MIEQSAPVLVGLIFVGAALLARSNARRRARAAQAWPTVPARVVTAEVVPTVGGYSPLVTYTYEIANVPYANDKLRLGGNPNFIHQEKAAEIVARYPLGANTQAHYDPARPERSTLELKSQGALLILFSIFAATAFALALLLMLSS